MKLKLWVSSLAVVSLGGVADFGGYTNGNILNTHTSGTFSTYLFGPRVSYRHYSRITPFGQVLVGAAHANAAAFGTASTQNAFAMTAGGGVDNKLRDHFSIRPFQAEYLMTRSGKARSARGHRTICACRPGCCSDFNERKGKAHLPSRSVTCQSSALTDPARSKCRIGRRETSTLHNESLAPRKPARIGCRVLGRGAAN